MALHNTVDQDDSPDLSDVEGASVSPIDVVAVRRMANQLVSSAWFGREIDRLSGLGYSLAQIATVITGSAASAFAAGIQHRVLLSVAESTQGTTDVTSGLSAASGQIHHSSDEIVDESGLYSDDDVAGEDEDADGRQVPVFAGERPGSGAIVPSRVPVGQFRESYVIRGRGTSETDPEMVLEQAEQERPQTRGRSRAETASGSVSAGVIRDLLVKLMTEHQIERLSLHYHEDLVNKVFDTVPELADLPYHARNRKIIDSVAGRKYGPVLGSENGRRFIYLA